MYNSLYPPTSTQGAGGQPRRSKSNPPPFPSSEIKRLPISRQEEEAVYSANRPGVVGLGVREGNGPVVSHLTLNGPNSLVCFLGIPRVGTGRRSRLRALTSKPGWFVSSPCLASRSPEPWRSHRLDRHVPGRGLICPEASAMSCSPPAARTYLPRWPSSMPLDSLVSLNGSGCAACPQWTGCYGGGPPWP